MQVIDNDNNRIAIEFLFGSVFVYKYFQKRYFKSRQQELLGINNYTEKTEVFFFTLWDFFDTSCEILEKYW